MMRILSKGGVILFLFAASIIVSCPSAVIAQAGRQYQKANQLIQQENYEQAYEILNDLIGRYPNSYPIYNQTVLCLVHLKKFDKAIQLTNDRLEGNYKNVVMAARLGHLYHLDGDTSLAFQVWNKTLNQNKENLQAYRLIANAMQQDRAYGKATNVYRLAQKRFNNPDLFLLEMANNYMQAGKYEKAMRKFLAFMKKSHNQISFIERQLLHYNDNYIYRVAIKTIKEEEQNRHINNPYKIALNKLLIWIYEEKGMDSQALQTAIKLEAIIPPGNYPVYRVAKKLSSDNKFKLAEKAFSFYSEKPQHILAARSLEEIAKVDIRWAQFLNDYNIDFSHKTDSLYHQAYQKIGQLTQKYPGYNRLSKVYVIQAELALNHIKNLKSAQSVMPRLEQLPVKQKSQSLINYLKGRIYLFKGNFNRARIYFTRSNKETRTGPLAEKDRYYLCLTDFYAHDYDFAKIQIEALEKNPTSLFANDALQLRIWIQDGKNRDSTTTQLNTFSRAQYLYAKGMTSTALDTLSGYILNSSSHPLEDDMMLFTVKILRDKYPVAAFLITDHYLSKQYYNGPLLERLLWERAQLAYLIFNNKELRKRIRNNHYRPEIPGFIQKMKPVFFDNQQRQRLVSLSKSKKDIISLYEQILVHYPRGFYSEFARNRIRNLQQRNPS